MSVLYIFIAILLLRFIFNLSRYLQTKKYHNLYIQWLALDRTPKIKEARAQVIALLKDAGVRDSYIPTAQPMGFGHIATANASVMDNFPNAREDFVAITVGMLLEATGTFRSRMWQTFNPLFWIEFLIHLPRYTLRYLGVSPDGLIVKVAQITWWMVCFIVGFAYPLYKPELESLVRGWFGKH